MAWLNLVAMQFTDQRRCRQRCSCVLRRLTRGRTWFGSAVPVAPKPARTAPRRRIGPSVVPKNQRAAPLRPMGRSASSTSCGIASLVWNRPEIGLGPRIEAFSAMRSNQILRPPRAQADISEGSPPLANYHFCHMGILEPVRTLHPSRDPGGCKRRPLCRSRSSIATSVSRNRANRHRAAAGRSCGRHSRRSGRSSRCDIPQRGLAAAALEGVPEGMKGLRPALDDVGAKVAREPFAPGLSLRFHRHTEAHPQRRIGRGGPGTMVVDEAKSNEFGMNGHRSRRANILQRLPLPLVRDVDEPNPFGALPQVPDPKLGNLGAAGA